MLEDQSDEEIEYVEQPEQRIMESPIEIQPEEKLNDEVKPVEQEIQESV